MTNSTSEFDTAMNIANTGYAAARRAYLGGSEDMPGFEQLIDAVRSLHVAVRVLSERVAELERANRQPDFLGDALNSGDGVYRP